jgi:hypothetical protein
VDLVNPTHEDPTNDSFWADLATVAGGDSTEVAAPTCTLPLFLEFAFDRWFSSRFLSIFALRYHEHRARAVPAGDCTSPVCLRGQRQGHSREAVREPFFRGQPPALANERARAGLGFFVKRPSGKPPRGAWFLNPPAS